MGILLLLLLLLFLLINVPVAIGIGLATIIVSLLVDIDLIRLPQSLFTSLNSFPLLAAPFFILAGKLMEHGGISEKLVNFATSLVGHLRGGLAYVSVLACMFFASISGSAIATIVAIGAIMIPSLIKNGYNREFASTLHAAGGTIGVLIPPSVPMVLYGVSAGVSIGQLFMAGIIPGILVGVSFMVVSFFVARKQKLEVLPRKSLKEVFNSFINALWAILMPVIILGGIYGGFFTPTEAAAVAVIYGFIIGLFVYKQINFESIKKILLSTVLTTSALGIIIATASFFGLWLTLERVPHNIATAISEADLSPIVTIIIINIFLLILGTFMDATAGLIISTPILVPIAEAAGMDPVQFGIMMIVNLGIGLLTPPLGVGLYIAAKIGNTKFEKLIKPALWFILVMIIDVAIIAIFPQITSGFASYVSK
ncbi:C4-dicarboxylate transporter DctM subunit OS=Ureibacillus acetophenoni OX=614649 GN=SAMN05877842_109135 PE=4 SV=1 [Ureibacillus acetophenoni]